jgi:negative regulator of flagellin synthesis FlgM
MVIQPNTDLTNTNQTRHKAASNTSTSTTDVPQTDSKSNGAGAEKSVRLSSQAQAIEKLEAKILSSEGVDKAKVDDIKQQIADGSYEMNTSNIAEKILAQETLLG